MKTTISVIIATIIVLASAIASACYPCSYASTEGDMSNFCAPSKPLWDASFACISATCAGTCSAWVSSVNACTMSGDPRCMPGGDTSDCDQCMEGKGPYAGIGCATTTSACSLDQAGCTSSCAAWIGGGAICDVVTQEEIDLSACACSGACASKCGSSCMPSGYGGTYYDNGQPMTQQCVACLMAKHGCDAVYAACLGA